MIESNALANGHDKRSIDAGIVKQALAEREYRTNLYQEEFLREYDRRSIKVRTQGQGVGVANGLSVTQVGDYVMGLPHQISCTVGVGHGGIMDLEREAELGGPIHTKGMMILKSYFVNLFARNKPLVLTGSLCFEQSYAQVDGDSASGAELAALLSALSNVPIRLDLAFTGAISQSGAIMAVGGVTHKVEGFFEVCRRRGLTGKQGVLLPRDNIVHLVLRDNVLQAIKDGQFHIHPVSTIEEAMEFLTGKRAGERLKDGRFSRNSIYAAVDERLTELAVLAEKKCAMPRRKSVKKPDPENGSGFSSLHQKLGILLAHGAVEPSYGPPIIRQRLVQERLALRLLGLGIKHIRVGADLGLVSGQGHAVTLLGGDESLPRGGDTLLGGLDL